jgi:NAD(P)-dependent dehydrogenase (short-subunit alcohol dehydrogenase family)
METRCALVTGSTDGIGKATAIELAARGVVVIVHGRTPEKAHHAKDQIERASGNRDLLTVAADFSSLAQVRRMSGEILGSVPALHVLINNAGIVTNRERKSEDGYELTFAVNHLAPFLLTVLLLDLIRRSAPARIINVSSMVHSGVNIDMSDLTTERLKRGLYAGTGAYALSKLANLLFTYALSRRLENTGVTVNALHPGVISTKLLHVNYSGGRPPEEGARTPVYLATAPELEKVTGNYFVNMRPASSSGLSRDTGLQERLWELSEELTGLL